MAKHIHIHVGGSKTKDAFDEAASQAIRLINQAGDILYKANLKEDDSKNSPVVTKREAVIRALLDAKTLAQKI